MKGEVISVDASTGGGLISGDDGARYAFDGAGSRGPVRVGDRVDFLGLDGQARDVMVLAGGAASSFGSAQSFGSAPSYAASGPVAGAGYDFASAMFSFNGRLRRSHFWISWAILFFGGLVLGLIPLLGMLISIVLLWPQFAIQAKRLHDMGYSGWLVLAPIAVNIVLLFVMFGSIFGTLAMNANALENEDPAAIMAVLSSMGLPLLLGFILNVGWLLWIGITDSKQGPNPYGPNPKYPEDNASVFN